jgi:hypothetical protein
MSSATFRRDHHQQVNDEVHADAPSQLARLIAVVTGFAMTILGIAAVVGVEWNGMTREQFDEPMSEVLDMAFTPITALVTLGVGLVLLIVAAARMAGASMVFGALLAAAGVANLAVDGTHTSWQVADRHGWVALAAGLVFLLAGLIMENGWSVRRTVDERDEVPEIPEDYRTGRHVH